MAPRPRNRKNSGLPPNLYERSGYYSWRNPLDGKEHGLGRDKRRAVAEANEANLHLIGILDSEPRLVDRLTGAGTRTVSAWADEYQCILAARDLAQATRSACRQRLAMINRSMGSKVMERVSTLDVAEFFKPWEDADKRRMAQAMRAFTFDFFREAQAKGWIEKNPVEPTKVSPVVVKRARLTLDVFRAIYAAAENMPARVQRSMELALVTAQRREDVSLMGFRDARDGRLWVEQGKTGARVCIPLDLRLNVIGWTVGQIIERCRDDVVSRHLIHHGTHAGLAKPGDKVRLATISAEFAAAREKAFPDPSTAWPDRTPPTFHEIRSLAARLFTEQGIDAQALLGHKSPNMTAIYRDVRGAEWIEVRTA